MIWSILRAGLLANGSVSVDLPRPRPPRRPSPLPCSLHPEKFPKFPKERPKKTRSANPKAGAGRGVGKKGFTKRGTAGSAARQLAFQQVSGDLLRRGGEGLGFGRVRPPATPNFARACRGPSRNLRCGGCRESAGDLRRVVIPSLAAKPGSPRVFFFFLGMHGALERE